MEDAQAAGVDGGRCLEGVDAPACGLTADELHLLVVNK